MTKENFNIGDIVKHKADNRRMVVVDYGRPDNNPMPNAKDLKKPICRFYDDTTRKYVTSQFITEELVLIEE